jgi:hypothetical protein
VFDVLRLDMVDLLWVDLLVVPTVDL